MLTLVFSLTSPWSPRQDQTFPTKEADGGRMEATETNFTTGSDCLLTIPDSDNKTVNIQTSPPSPVKKT
jgi:hypothetical protein